MSEAKVLVVEDDSALREALCDTLEMAGYQVASAADGGAALKQVELEEVGMVVSDVHMKPMDGHHLLHQLRERYPNLPVVLMTAYGNVENAVKSMRDGAADYLVKPFEGEVLINMVNRYISQTDTNPDLIAEDSKTIELAALAERVAASDATVMISGESGTGKEVFARHIHRCSARADKPFVAINCAAIPENMLEAVLFGYEKGAYTGAISASAGTSKTATTKQDAK
ncbi:MAG TPA: sigma-54-dependent Fis family transcriptional regulator [Candidatus Tenderia sp.]|nr:sigma-54-dependent Fis family transcriptional regulator [Candidatus Tenderia sp.]